MDFAPMLASLVDAPLADPDLVYEPKYDGIRAIADVPAHGRVRLWSRLGNEKTKQFPEVAEALETWAERRKVPAVVDGEIVALDSKGHPIGFQNLQGRIHLKNGPAGGSRVAYIAFDLLSENGKDLRELPLIERRAALERLFADAQSPMLRLSEQVRGDGQTLYDRALANGWEGIIAKRARSRYQSGRRTPDWRKVKLVREQEFVIGGWTEPRQTRTNFGALLLGVYEGDALVYVGHTGTGFNEKELARVMKLLRPREIKACPFRECPPTNERPHWVKPDLIAQVKFTEWTDDAKLRHPVYLGLRDDKKPTEVRREEVVPSHATAKIRLTTSAKATAVKKPDPTYVGSGFSTDAVGQTFRTGVFDNVIAQLRALEDARRDGTIELPDGDRVAVTNLAKVFWPRQKFTKGDLLRYYAAIAPCILPAVADRPLVMKRYPNGINAAPFYQHRVNDAPPGVRVEPVKAADGRPHFIGGNLKTLLHMTQLASISQDPWFSRVQTPECPDQVALDLDPMPDVPFTTVLDVARWVRDELHALKASGFAKTSGADGLHIYIAMPPDTPYEAAVIFCQIVATMVAAKHPKQATVERAVKGRGKRVYVDCLQNILGKTLATAYSARSSEYAGVSTPLSWKEIEDGVRREDFTITSIPARLKEVGDLWAGVRKAKPVDLSRIARYAQQKR